MDISTRKVLKRTLSTTNTHVELDHLVEVEEKIGDVSVSYNSYNNYDEANIPVIDASVIESLKEYEIELRHTHLYLPENINEKLYNMNEYYKENKIGPYAYAFNGPSNN